MPEAKATQPPLTLSGMSIQTAIEILDRLSLQEDWTSSVDDETKKLITDLGVQARSKDASIWAEQNPCAVLRVLAAATIKEDAFLSASMQSYSKSIAACLDAEASKNKGDSAALLHSERAAVISRLDIISSIFNTKNAENTASILTEIRG